MKYLEEHAFDCLIVVVITLACLSVIYLTFYMEQRTKDNCRQAAEYRPVPERCVGL